MTTAAPMTSVEVVTPRMAARIGAVSLVFGAFGNLITVLPANDSVRWAAIGFGLSVAMLVTALVSFMVPWDRLGPRATMAFFVPTSLLMMVVGNYTDPLPYVAGIYLILIGAWVGATQARFTTLKLAPVMAVTLYLPLSMSHDDGRLASSTIIITAVSVVLGEILGLFRVRLETLRRDLIRSNRSRFEALTRNSIDVSLVLGSDNRLTFVSPSVTAQFGYTPDELLSIPLDTFLTEMVRGISPHDLKAVVAGTFEGLGETHRYELTFLNAGGEWIDVEVTVHNLSDDPDVDGIVVHLRDISERLALEEDLFHRAFHDDLTGVANRAAFHGRVQQLLDTGRRTAVVFLDLDGFKLVNDTLGHRRGDELLRVIAERLVTVAPREALVARLGGDEFAVVGDLCIERATSLAHRLITAISEPLDLGSGTVTVGAKAGVAEGGPAIDADRLMENADMAMYEAKATRDVDVVHFEPRLRQGLIDRGRLQADLQRAVENEEFVLHYQPQIDLANGRWTGAESLIRWRRPDAGLVCPGEFISEAEESKVILAIGRWVLMEACREAATWAEVDGTAHSVSVNVSPRQFSSDGFVQDVHEALESSGLDPGRLVVEVTESVLIHDFVLARKKLDALSAVGIGISLDDFGTGFSSLRYLLELPFSVLKIDKSFVTNATTEFGDLSLLQTINRLGHDLGLKTLIEGIETSEQARLVASVGIDQAQGFFYSRPVEAAVVRPILELGGPHPGSVGRDGDPAGVVPIR